MLQKPLINRVIPALRRPSTWLLVALFLLVTFLQDTELADLGLTRYSVERILYLLPIIWAAFLLGWKGGAITSLAAVACMLPRAILTSPNPEDAFVEIGAVFIIGSLMSYSLESLRRERERSARLKAVEEELQFFIQQITRAQEEERKRISWELHDDAVQSLVVLCHQIDDLSSSVKGLPRQARPRLEKMHQQAEAIMLEIRRLSQDLRPAALDNLGLVSTLEWLTSDVTRHSGVPTNLKVLGIERRLSTEVELVLFRIAQEALRNVWKHARASSAQVTLEFANGKTGLTISDDGKGFDPPSDANALAKFGKLGLAGMQERAHLLGGTLSVKSEPGKGTTVTAELPM